MNLIAFCNWTKFIGMLFVMFLIIHCPSAMSHVMANKILGSDVIQLSMTLVFTFYNKERLL